MCNKIILPIHRKCGRVLKPYFKGKDFLVCRYCEFKVEVCKIREEGIKIAIKDAEINQEIVKEEELKIKEQIENRGPNDPFKCPICDSKRVTRTGFVGIWECHSCEGEFHWKKYKIIYSGEVELYAFDYDNAVKRAYKCLDDELADIDVDVTLKE